MSLDLLQCLADGATVITPTRRLARHLGRAFDSWQAAAGRRAWPSADVLPWASWVERSLDESVLPDQAAAQRLNPIQEQELWRTVIADALPDADAAPLARLALEAWRLQHEWRIPGPASDAHHSAEVLAYAGWAAEFGGRCRRRGWTSFTEAAEMLARSGSASWRGRRIVLYAFDALNLQQTAIVAQCERIGAQVQILLPPPRTQSIWCRGCDDSAAEYRQIAAASRRILQRNAAARIGIVVPDLATERASLTRALDDVFDPSGSLSSQGGVGSAYNVSLGLPLARWPAVRTLLTTVRFACEEITLASVGEWLLSPYLGGGQSELHERARFDGRLREHGALMLTAEDFVAALADFYRSHGRCRVLAGNASRWLASARAWHAQRLPSQWAEAFAGALEIMGWPGERALDSTEFQVIEKAREALHQLATLDIVSGRVRVSAALAQLARLLGDAVFQPESDECSVQVLGVLESAGLEFDHLFVTGMTDQAWPAPPRANPLLPLPVQRARGVPHAYLQWERAFAQRTMDMWSATAREVVYSWPRWRRDAHLRPSALLAGVPAWPDADDALQASRTLRLWQARAQERVDDEIAPALPVGQKAAGGARIFTDQSACPFKAFAVHRLSARELEEGRAGPDARARGQLVHAVMAAFTRRVDSQARLLAMGDSVLREQVLAAVDEGLAQSTGRRDDLLPQALLATERERLAALLGRFVELERGRAPYRVLSSEAAAEVTLRGLTVRTRPDRIDEIELPDGGTCQGIIDYKTGQVTVTDWFGERPAEPQLPLYAVTLAAPAGLLAFAKLDSDDMAWKGLSAQPGLAPGVKTPDPGPQGEANADAWGELLRQWRARLETLADEYLGGYAAVRPREGSKTCAHCGLQTLCRIDEGGLAQVEEDDDQPD